MDRIAIVLEIVRWEPGTIVDPDDPPNDDDWDESDGEGDGNPC